MPATDFLDLKRRFRDLRDAELAHAESEAPRLLTSLDEWGLGPTVGWDELLEHSRVALPAEAGAGKSREMSEQAKRLSERRRYSFFVYDPCHPIAHHIQRNKFLTAGIAPNHWDSRGRVIFHAR